MIETVDDMLDHIESDGFYRESIEGWIGYYVNDDYELVVSFERDSPRENLSGKWKLVPIDD